LRLTGIAELQSELAIARNKRMDQSTGTTSANELQRGILFTLVLLLPLALIILFIYLHHPSENTGEIFTVTPSSAGSKEGRLVVVIVDSLRRQAVTELMPHLRGLAQQGDSVDLDVRTAAGNMSLPCIQTLLEGRESPYVSAIHNFTAPRQSAGGSLPAIAAKAGLKPALIGDGIICGLYQQHASTSINVVSWDMSPLDRDLRGIDEAMRLLRDPTIRVIILHTPGTDKAAHHWNPGHPEYEKHFRAVDAKLAEFFAQLDLSKDYLIVTGDHGHNDLGSHVPRSLAIFAGGQFPHLFATLGPLGELQQVDLLFFMTFAEDLPLPIHYEGRYFGLENSLDLTAAKPAFRTHLENFARLQHTILAHNGFDAPTVAQAIAKKRIQMGSADALAWKRIFPLLIFYFGWILFAFRTNDVTGAPLWPLIALAPAAAAVYLLASPSLGLTLGLFIGLAALVFAQRTGELGRFCFVLLLGFAAAFTAYQGEHWRNLFVDRQLWFFMTLIGAGSFLAIIHGANAHALPAAIGALCLFALPSGVYEPQLGQNILRGFFLGYALICIWVLVTRSFLRVRFSRREWIVFGVLIFTIVVFLLQKSHGWAWHSLVLDQLRDAKIGTLLAVSLFSGCAAYLIWIGPRFQARITIAALLLGLVIYCAWFAELPFYELATVLIPPVFLASYITVTARPGPFHDASEDAHERAGILLFGVLLMAFWILFQGFFVQDINFTFGLKHLDPKASEGRLFLLLYPLTLLKYGLPLLLILFSFIALRGLRDSQRVIIAALIFCNLKLATLLVQIFVGPLRSRQKLYELAVSDFVFVSQILVIVGLSYICIVAFAASLGRLVKIPVVVKPHAAVRSAI